MAINTDWINFPIFALSLMYISLSSSTNSICCYIWKTVFMSDFSKAKFSASRAGGHVTFNAIHFLRLELRHYIRQGKVMSWKLTLQSIKKADECNYRMLKGSWSACLVIARTYSYKHIMNCYIWTTEHQMSPVRRKFKRRIDSDDCIGNNQTTSTSLKSILLSLRVRQRIRGP